MAHRVNFYDLDAGFDDEGWMRPAETIETDDSEEATRLATEAIQSAGSISAASIGVDHTLCDTLPEYLALTNAIGRWLEENPLGGQWIGCLTEDLDHWHSMGVTTPEDMVKYEILSRYSDYYKELNGFRPRGHELTMDTPLEELEAAMDALRPPPCIDDSPAP